MSFDLEEENKFLLPKYKFNFTEGTGDDDKIDLIGNNKALNHYKIYENCNLKKHKKDYAFIEVIDLKDYPNPFFLSRTRVLLLLDDLLGVDVMCIGDYHPFESQNDLKYILGHDEQSFLAKAIIHCKEILKETFTFENTIVLKTWDNKKLARIYIKDFDLKENTTTVDAIKEAIKCNESLKDIDLKIRGRYSEYLEESMNGVSPENTYIQIIDTDKRTPLMRSYSTKKVCVQCLMYNVLIENSEKNGLRFELIPQEIKSKECLEKDNLKWHKQSYSWYDTIILNEYPNPYYFSKIPVMLLLDDLLGVDIILIIDCAHSISSTNILLKYELGHNNQVLLDQATAMCKEILKSSLGSLAFERSMFFTKLNGHNLCRIYLKDLGLVENELTVEKIEEAFTDNKIFEKVTVKTRGRYSGYYEESLKGVSFETTYIQIEGANLKIYLPDIFEVLKNLRESINQENISE